MPDPKSLVKRVSIAVALGASLLAAKGGGPDAPKQGVFTISDNVNLVLLDVSVKAAKGGYVTGLQKDNFQVFEDGQPRQITHFASVDTPVTIGLVVDNSGSMRPKRASVEAAALALVTDSNPGDEYFIARGVVHSGDVVAGTRTIHAFGGRRADRVGAQHSR